MYLRRVYFGVSFTGGLSPSGLTPNLISDIVEDFNIFVVLFKLFFCLLDGEFEFAIDFGTFIELFVFKDEFSDFRWSQSGTNF